MDPIPSRSYSKSNSGRITELEFRMHLPRFEQISALSTSYNILFLQQLANIKQSITVAYVKLHSATQMPCQLA